MSFEVIPSIDLQDGKVVRLKQGDYRSVVNYDVEPIATAKSYAKAGANWLHVVDLDGAKEGQLVQIGLISDLIKTGLNVQAGGGIRSTEDVRKLLDAGAARVVIGTKAMEDWPWFDRLMHTPEFDRRIVLAVDARDGRVATHAWTETTMRLATDVARDVSGYPLAALLYTDVAKDGMLQGPNMENTRLIAEAGSVPVIASGGVGSLEHIRELAALPIMGVVVGRSLYEGRLDLGEAIRQAKRIRSSSTSQ